MPPTCIAQMTIMSRSCAERYNLLRLMDRRWAGTAVGVGSAKILGECCKAAYLVTGRGCMGVLPILLLVSFQAGVCFEYVDSLLIDLALPSQAASTWCSSWRARAVYAFPLAGC